jgi:cytochrome c
MQMARYSGLVIISAFIAACGGGGSSESADGVKAPQVPTASTLGDQLVSSTDDYLAQEPYLSADPAKGEKLVVLCRACHSFNKGGSHMIGPNLHGFFGSKIASRDDFDYSQAASEANFVWTPRALDAWMAQPGQFLPGNRMTFAGIGKPQDRTDIIAFLLRATNE